MIVRALAFRVIARGFGALLALGNTHGGTNDYAEDHNEDSDNKHYVLLPPKWECCPRWLAWGEAMVITSRLL